MSQRANLGWLIVDVQFLLVVDGEVKEKSAYY